jgi:hypothetical protein
MMNDGVNLYIAVSVNGDDDLNAKDWIDFTFYNEHDGGASLEPGDDDVAVDGTGSFNDIFYDFSYPLDTSDGGTSDGQGAAGRQGGSNYFELSHPLDSADDAHDFSLSTGQTVGFILALLIDDNYADLRPYGLAGYTPSEFANYLVTQPAVGGLVMPSNKLEILTPYLALAGLIAAVSTVYVVKRRKD